MNFGVFLNPAAEGYPDLLRQVEAAERGGLDLVGIQDHPYQPRFLDTFVLIADLLARTERLRFFPAVANLPLRPPAMLAKAGASLDVMSGGRFELGIGAGAFWEGVAAMGGPRREPGESVEALEDAVEILRLAWGGERSVTYDGEHHSVRGFKPGPPPAHSIQIWVGAYRPRMLRLTGRLADGWFPSFGYAGADAVPEMRRRLDEAAVRAGRPPHDVRRIYNLSGEITDGEERGLLQVRLRTGSRRSSGSGASSASTTSSSDPEATTRFVKSGCSPPRWCPASVRRSARRPDPPALVRAAHRAGARRSGPRAARRAAGQT